MVKDEIIQLGNGDKGSIYTKHQSLIKHLILEILNCNLSDTIFPYVETSKNNDKKPPKQIIVFTIGGITYEEAYQINQINTSTEYNIILGGTTIHNTKSFVEELLLLRSMEKGQKNLDVFINPKLYRVPTQKNNPQPNQRHSTQ